MRQLIYKDLFFFRVMWLVYLIAPLMFSFIEPVGETVFSTSCLLITISTSMILIGMDEKNKSDVIMNSLPLSRKDIVIARYISCAIFIAGSMFVTMFVIFLIRGVVVISDISAYHPNLYIEIPWYAVVRGAISSLVYIAVLFPSYYGTKSKMACGLFTGGAAMVGVFAGIFIGDGETAALSFIEWVIAPSHFIWFLVGVIILASVYIASMFLTIKIYETHDL
ncbi:MULTISPECIES: ABC-2 transporter permease [Bacillus]|uniref:ABC transporter permease n=2 Tax=Bacillus cereus group TaxID=86661 RepID=R8MNN5_BACCX|nr:MULTISPECIES: ABC-2 transporter permease [Bacillus]EOP35737.1 ABC transporter permease [Bacillus cereus VD146]MDR4903525.1 ABC-2 transporter permease [Bacillus mycoides]MED1021477.1 ABC-2 transporter permease [Bacillus mycoides]MED1086163.1 ABC-2 transporter permease [Bacillus mycoides]UYO19190.1 ABC-2 transporter permease [Bacillus sp. 41-22]